MTKSRKPNASSDDNCRLPPLRLGELEGHQRGNRVAGREDARADPVGVADDERDRHGFTKGSAEAQHDAAYDGAARVGQDDTSHHLPRCAAEAERALLEDDRNRQKHVPHRRGDEGDDHYRQHHGRGEDTRIARCRAEHTRQAGDLTESGGEKWLDRMPDGRRQDEEAPHAVDDGRHGGEQLDGGADRPAHPIRRQFREEECDAKGEWHCHDEGKDRAHNCSVNRHQGAETLGDRVPSGRAQETQTKGTECRQAAFEQQHDDAAEQNKHENAGGVGSHREYAVARAV